MSDTHENKASEEQQDDPALNPEDQPTQESADQDPASEDPVNEEPASEDPTGEDSSTGREPQPSFLPQDVAPAVEAVLFTTDAPLPISRIAQVVEAPQRLVKQAIALLNERYDASDSAFRIESIAGGYQMMTLAKHHDVLDRLLQTRHESKLSQAAMETLAIIAYRQPILRADIEAIRGVASGEILRGLMEKNLVKIVGRAEVLGRPMLYGTTKHFLELFGLGDLKDLPRVEELREGAVKPIPVAKPKEEADSSQTPQASDNEQATEADKTTEPQPTQEPGDKPKPLDDDELDQDYDDYDDDDDDDDEYDDDDEEDDEDSAEEIIEEQ